MLLDNKRINIMHLVLSLEVGGLEKVVVDSVLGLDKIMFNVEVCCFDDLGKLADCLTQYNITVTLLRKNQVHYDYLYPIKLSKLLKAKNIHVLHMHSGTFFHGTQAGILARTPAMIYTDHGRHLVDPKILLYMDRFSGIFASKIIAVSKELETYLIDVVKLPAYKTTTIINGINTDTFRYKEKSLTLLKELNIPVNYKIIGTVGRLAEVKDQSTMINSLIKVREKLPDTMLLLIGDGPLRSELQRLVANKGLNNNVRFLGNRVDVPDLLNLLDVFLLTSLSEGTSISLLEAMSSGIAPIVTNVGGNPSLVDDNIHGILISPQNVAELAENLIELLQNDEKRKIYGENASLRVREKFSLAKMVKEYEKLYINLLNGNPKGPCHFAYRG
jgi:L-malate glycosyltransferase